MLATNDMLHVLECEKKDKTIDLMAEYIASKKLLIDKQLNILTSDCIKEYFERKAEGNQNGNENSNYKI